MKTTKERENEFLIGLAKLTRETGIKIAGCGCCGSPEIVDSSDDELGDKDAGYGYGFAGEVTWISHADDYNWKNFSKSIVRSPLEVLARPNGCADQRSEDRDDHLRDANHHLAASPEKD